MSRDIGALVDAAMSRHRVGNSEFIASLDALEAFEARFGYPMPPDFGHFQLNVRHVELDDRVSPYYNTLRAARVPYFGLSIEMIYDTELPRLYLHDDLPEEWGSWLTRLVPCATEGDYNYLCLDFAFDSENPPVIIIEFERGSQAYGSGLSDQHVYYVADSFLQMLEFEIIDEDGNFETRSDRVSQRMVDWVAHRNNILSPNAEPPFSPNASDINWP